MAEVTLGYIDLDFHLTQVGDFDQRGGRGKGGRVDEIADLDALDQDSAVRRSQDRRGVELEFRQYQLRLGLVDARGGAVERLLARAGLEQVQVGFHPPHS